MTAGKRWTHKDDDSCGENGLQDHKNIKSEHDNTDSEVDGDKVDYLGSETDQDSSSWESEEE